MTDEHNNNRVMLVLSTCPADQANQLAGMLVEGRLAACVNIIPDVTSIYRWQGRVERETEALMVIKCASDNYAVLEQRLRAAHPYELPEIVTVPQVGGLPEYLQWVLGSCQDPDPEPSS